MATPIPDNKYSTLTQIQNKARRLSRSLDENLLTADQLNEYINTFVLYDFPEQLRLFNLHETFSFYTQAFVSEYKTDSSDVTDVLYNFKNQYLTVNPPIYVAGYEAKYFESRQQFFTIYPRLASIQSIGTTGNGTQTAFNGVINAQQGNVQPFVQNNTQGTILLQNNVLFTSNDINNVTMNLIDYPLSVEIGILGLPGVVPDMTLPSLYGTINYLTGAFGVNFPNPPAAGQQITSEVVFLQPSRPQSMLFYDGKFTLRPVPDRGYKIDMEVYKRPTELIDSGQAPELSEWWQYISYGTAKKILEDRMDLETVALILPEFKEQENLILRRTIVQQTTQRVSTIYSDQNTVNGAYGGGWWGGSGGSY